MNTQALYCHSCKKNYDVSQEDLDLMQQYNRNFDNLTKQYTNGCFFKNLGKIKHIIAKEQEFIIYNINYGVHDYVSIALIEIDFEDTYIWLEEPYDMVGPLSYNELKNEGKTNFAACMIMSKQRYKEDELFLRKESFKKQQKAQEQFNEDIKHYKKSNETQHRELLSLPKDGTLEVSQIKAAYRQIIKVVHPDTGGSHEKFIEVTKARDILIQNIQ